MGTRRRTRDIDGDAEDHYLDAKRKSEVVGADIQDSELPKVKHFLALETAFRIKPLL